MIVLIVVILLAVLVAGSISSNLMDAFNDPNWIDIKEWEL